MNTRFLLAVAGLLLVLVAGAAAWRLATPARPDIEAAPADDTPLPVPPVPPRIAQGPEYEQCLGLLETDPAAAATFARNWQNGGDGSVHCLALANIALGNQTDGAAMLERLAADSQADPAARALVFSQAAEAWSMADDDARAYAAASRAVALNPDDIDLLLARAAIADSLERPADALVDLDRAIALDGKRTDALTQHATALRHLDRLDAADADIARVLAIDPDFPEALLERGILRQRRGDAAGAREDWQRTIDLAPDTPAADLAEQNLALLEAGPDRQ
jgi:tetratricopeptide (TPR) repeat protein